MHLQPASAPLPAESMPSPNTLIACPGGEVMPAMFFYAVEGADLRRIASDYGFEVCFADLDAFCCDELDWKRYDAEPGAVLAEFTADVPEGWQFGGKWHSDNGVAACFLRPIGEQH